MIAGAAQARVACPALAGGRPLSFITVFDGPPSENASLVPDTSRAIAGGQTATWRLGGIYRAGRMPYLRCEYRGARPIVVPVRRARSCRYAEKGRYKSLSCE